MGRGRPASSTKAAAKTAEKPTRATRGAPRKSYVEEAGSEEEEYQQEVIPSSPEAVEENSESDYGAETSGSEYGKKKKKVKLSPKRTIPGKRGRKPTGRAQLSPKKRGRKPAVATASSTKNGKRRRPAESSEEEEEHASSPDEVSDEDMSGSEETSGSEYGKKKTNKSLKKEKPPTRTQPKRQAAPAPKKRGRKPKAAAGPTNGNKKLKLDELLDKSEDDDIDEKIVEKKADEDADEEGTTTTEDEVKDEEMPAVSDKKSTKKREEEKTAKRKHPTSTSEEDSEGADGEDELKPEEEKKSLKISEESSSKSKPDTVNVTNQTSTDYTKLDFDCEKTNTAGDKWNFKIASWNAAGLRALIKKNGLDYIKNEKPDILCIQETKVDDKTKPVEFNSLSDYPHIYWNFSETAGQSGVVTLSKVKAESVTNGIPLGDSDSPQDKKFKNMFNKEGRIITTEFEKFYLLNAYVPNGGRGVKDDKQNKLYPPRVTNGERQAWDRLVAEHVKVLEEKKPVIVCGDLNVAHEPIDLANPKTNTNSAGFTVEERDGFTELMTSRKLVDSFRTLYPETQAYTFWTYMGNARAKNVGWRLDYFLLSEKLRESLCECLMRKDVYGSDHCPVVLFIHL